MDNLRHEGVITFPLMTMRRDGMKWLLPILMVTSSSTSPILSNSLNMYGELWLLFYGEPPAVSYRPAVLLENYNST